MSIQKIREDILALRGANVHIFGQPTTLPEDVNEGVIDILDVLKELEEFEVELVHEIYDEDIDEDVEITFDSVEKYVDYMEDELGTWKEIGSDNSYNWSAPVSNDFNFTTYKDTETGDFYVKFMVHRFGDVRANYTEYALLKFSYEEGFLYAVMEANKSIDLDDKYYAHVDILSDGYEVFRHVDDEQVGTIYSVDDFDASEFEKEEAEA